MQPKVSVIIPLYNSISFLAETIESVLYQSYENIEVIIVDDDSKDGSIELAKTFASSIVKVVKNKGKGACAARNYGFEMSTGDYIQFLDADDLLSPDKIEKQVQVLQNTVNQLAVCDTVHFYDSPETGTSHDADFLITTENPEAFFIKLWGGPATTFYMVQTSAWLTPRHLIETYGLWDETLAKDQDGEFFARMGLHSQGIVYVPEIKNYYRKHRLGQNIASKKQRKHIESNLKATGLKAKYLLSKTDSKAAKSALAKQFKFVAMEAWPNFKDITKRALLESESFGGSPYKPVLGGRIIELIHTVFGWKIAKALSYYGHVMIKK
ncbi:glycosyltransferase family 2 protein [Formosa sp. S-31]|uniref:glycosyltransferase family 2 protein n=1 Tax=Formosa sp. S-31 TaxID=2790949 RepID=UPI003EBC0583